MFGALKDRTFDDWPLAFSKANVQQVNVIGNFSKLAVKFSTKTGTEALEVKPDPLTLATLRRMLVLHLEGVSTSNVHYFVGPSQIKVCNIFRCHREKGQLKPRFPLGRLRLTTRINDRKMLNLWRRTQKCQKVVFADFEENTMKSTPSAKLYFNNASNMVT